jgi:5-formyltetrahydrofolate cyclo-ligase
VLKKVKKAIRHAVNRQRELLTPEWIEDASRVLCERVMRQAVFAQAETVGLYLALPGEVRTERLIEACRREGRRICLPAFDPVRRVYRMAEWPEGTPLVAGRWNIPEPPVEQAGPEPELMIVPGVAFDPHGMRVGRGGGYYDRMLAARPAWKTGVAFDFQVVDRLEAGAHDIHMDSIATEQKLYVPDPERNLVRTVVE